MYVHTERERINKYLKNVISFYVISVVELNLFKKLLCLSDIEKVVYKFFNLNLFLIKFC